MGDFWDAWWQQTYQIKSIDKIPIVYTALMGCFFVGTCDLHDNNGDASEAPLGGGGG